MSHALLCMSTCDQNTHNLNAYNDNTKRLLTGGRRTWVVRGDGTSQSLSPTVASTPLDFDILLYNKTKGMYSILARWRAWMQRDSVGACINLLHHLESNLMRNLVLATTLLLLVTWACGGRVDEPAAVPAARATRSADPSDQCYALATANDCQSNKLCLWGYPAHLESETEPGRAPSCIPSPEQSSRRSCQDIKTCYANEACLDWFDVHEREYYNSSGFPADKGSWYKECTPEGTR
jgi:hypothetical protein